MPNTPKNNPLVSIVVSVYNTEKYLDKCIKSILDQTYKNLEIIIINDGSTDSSQSICERFKDQESRITLIDKANTGAADSRNIAIQKANGEYIAFVDSDDYIDKKFIEILIKNMFDYDCQISACNYASVYENGKTLIKNKPLTREFNNIEAVRDVLVENSILETMLWNKLFKINLFTNNNIKMPVGDIYEDTRIIYKLHFCAQKIFYTNQILYYYIQRNGSVMNQGVKIKNLKLQTIITLETRDWLIDKTDKLNDEINAYILTGQINILNYMVDGNKIYSDIWSKANNNIKKNLINIIKNPFISKKRKYLCILINFGKIPYSKVRKIYTQSKKQKGIIIDNTNQSKLNKKALILTLRLGQNYGGIIQAYALQRFIKNLGFNATTSTPTKNPNMIKRILGALKRKLLNYNNSIVLNKKEIKTQIQKTESFINNNIDTIKLYRGNKLSTKIINQYDNIVVGSDQVWRAKYVKIPLYLLNFVKNTDINLISYAASFGKDDLSEYSPKLIKKSSQLSKRFKAISVREYSGINICKENWDINAEQLVDPTLLITRGEYAKLVNNDVSVMIPEGDLFTYILDRSPNKQKIVEHIAKKLMLKSFEIMPPDYKSKKEFCDNPEKFILPPVTKWLKSFVDAKFIITDSFHGCVFSIIFNKPFIAIGNKSRGLARFDSLLKLFNLENRLISKIEDINDNLISSTIDWNKINEIIISERKKSTDYFNKNLNNEHDL